MTLSDSIYEELCKKEHWNRVWERSVQAEKFSSDIYDTIYTLITTDKYKKIAHKLAYGEFVFSTPRKVKIAKNGTSKKRVVYCYTEFERFVMSVLYQALSALYDAKLSKYCFAYRKGISVISAVKSIKKYYDKKELYGVKVDIHAYFNSVSKDFLYSCIDELFPVNEPFSNTINQLYKNDTVFYNGEKIEEYKALIPGCALGSFWANYCLREVDFHFENLNIAYARYSDDIIFFCNTAEERDEHLRFLQEALEKRGLEINPDKYEYFEPTDAVTFLGLTLSDKDIDISKHAFEKMKKTIKRWCRKGRKRMEMQNESFDSVASGIMRRWNYRMYKSYIYDTSKYGWGYYAFRYITSTKTLKALDTYVMDTIRAMKTGKHNKKNKYALTEDDWGNIGFVSCEDMYFAFKTDFEYYCDIVARL